MFLGLSYAAYWSEIAGLPLPREVDALAKGRTSQTLFIAAKHPVARGASNAYFRGVGELIAKESDQRLSRHEPVL